MSDLFNTEIGQNEAGRENPTKGFSRLIGKREFNKLFEQFTYRHDLSRVFDDLLTCTLCAFALGRQEELYLETIRGYSKEEVTWIAQLFGLMVQAYDERSQSGGWCDILGDYFMEHNGKFGRDAKGQFFSPEHICDMMARVIGNESPTGNINDPACGSGRMLIAYDRLDPNHRLKNFYVGQDQDHRCVKMAAINMKLYGMKGVVIHMNTLSMEIYSGYRVMLPEVGGMVHFLTADECKQYVLQPKNTADDAEVVEEPRQTKLIIPDW